MFEKPSLERIGFFYDQNESTPHVAAMLRTTAAAITLEIPLLRGVSDMFENWFQTPFAEVPSLVFRDIFGKESLNSLRYLTHDQTFPNGMGRGVLSVGQMVHCEATVSDYSEPKGVRSEIRGLPRWMRPKVFSSVYSQDEYSLISGVTFEVERAPSVTVSSVPTLRLAPHFSTSHRWSEGIHTMRETMQVETVFEAPGAWRDHVQIHRTMQDLVSLAFWQPCALTVVSACNDEDSGDSLLLDSPPGSNRWREAMMPSAGRRVSLGQSVDLGDSIPLFDYDDIGADGISKWFDEYSQLGQTMWVLAASLFRSGGIVEVQLLQVGTALEALGYELAAREQLLVRGSKTTFSFEKALQLVCDSVGCSLERLLGGETTVAWTKSFNRTYKGVKHADNPFPDPNDAERYAE